MYIPDIFEEKDQSRIFSFIRENSFGVIITAQAGSLVATHTPLLLQQHNDELVLLGHIAAQNSQAAALQNGTEVLCIFSGPHAYVSPQWYTEPDVPDWNYRAVHVYGPVRLIEGDEVLRRMEGMAHHYEADTEKPAKMNEVPPEVLAAAVPQMVVFEVMVKRTEAIARLSQDHTETAQRNITQHLKQHHDFNAMLVAFDMERMKKK